MSARKKQFCVRCFLCIYINEFSIKQGAYYSLCLALSHTHTHTRAHTQRVKGKGKDRKTQYIQQIRVP